MRRENTWTHTQKSESMTEQQPADKYQWGTCWCDGLINRLSYNGKFLQVTSRFTSLDSPHIKGPLFLNIISSTVTTSVCLLCELRVAIFFTLHFSVSCCLHNSGNLCDSTSIDSWPAPACLFHYSPAAALFVSHSKYVESIGAQSVLEGSWKQALRRRL